MNIYSAMSTAASPRGVLPLIPNKMKQPNPTDTCEIINRTSAPVDRPNDRSVSQKTNPGRSMEYQGGSWDSTGSGAGDEQGGGVRQAGGRARRPHGNTRRLCCRWYGTGGGQVQPMRDDHKTDGVLRRSGSSSSSSSEDEGVGGRRKKGMKEKIKEKLPGGHKDEQQQQQQTAVAGEYTGTQGAQATGDKKGVMDKIKEIRSDERPEISHQMGQG